jgi:hypothetical protein
MRQRLLIACYRSGQITERQWQEHLKEDPKLRNAWRRSLKDGTSAVLLG